MSKRTRLEEICKRDCKSETENERQWEQERERATRRPAANDDDWSMAEPATVDLYHSSSRCRLLDSCCCCSQPFGWRVRSSGSKGNNNTKKRWRVVVVGGGAIPSPGKASCVRLRKVCVRRHITIKERESLSAATNLPTPNACNSNSTVRPSSSSLFAEARLFKNE